MKILLRTMLLLTLLIAAQACSMPSFKAQTTRVQTAAHVPGAPIEVSTRNGRIEIVADSTLDQVEVTAEITCRGETQADADARLASTTIRLERASDEVLRVEPAWPGGQPRGGEGVSFTIRLPDADGVTANTGNGRVIVKGLAGTLDIRTSNGRVEITEHDGDAMIASSNGRIIVTDLGGSLHAQTSNGDVTAKGIAGGASIDTSNGTIVLVLDPDQPGPLRLDTSNGSIDVTVGSAFRGEVELDTSNGRITINDPAGRIRNQNVRKSEAEFTVGDAGGEKSRIDSSNGSITFTIDE